SFVAAAVGIAFITGAIVFSGTGFSSAEKVSKTASKKNEHQTSVKEMPEKTEKRPELVDTGKTYDVSGVVTFIGEVPQGKKLNLPAGCDSGDGDVYSDEVIVNNGKLQNVLVRVVSGHEGKKFSHDVPQEEI